MMAITTSSSTQRERSWMLTFHDFFIGSEAGSSTDLVICARCSVPTGNSAVASYRILPGLEAGIT